MVNSLETVNLATEVRRREQRLLLNVSSHASEDLLPSERNKIATTHFALPPSLDPPEIMPSDPSIPDIHQDPVSRKLRCSMFEKMVMFTRLEKVPSKSILPNNSSALRRGRQIR